MHHKSKAHNTKRKSKVSKDVVLILKEHVFELRQAKYWNLNRPGPSMGSCQFKLWTVQDRSNWNPLKIVTVRGPSWTVLDRSRILSLLRDQ